jgi:hypothetical protein
MRLGRGWRVLGRMMIRRSFRVIRCDVAGYLYMVLWEVVDTFRVLSIYTGDLFKHFDVRRDILDSFLWF